MVTTATIMCQKLYDKKRVILSDDRGKTSQDEYDAVLECVRGKLIKVRMEWAR